MTTLKDLVIATKCRKGPAKGTTKRGAFWLAIPPIVIRRCGGDGIGNSGSDVTYELEMRHYRNGDVRFLVAEDSWHQNTGRHRECLPIDLGGCETVEHVICELKGFSFGPDGYYEGSGSHVFSDYYEEKLTEALVSLGMPVADPAPDEQVPVDIADNPINLRLATDFETECGLADCSHPKPDYVLASDSAFPGSVALYRGCRDEEGRLISGGWICNLK